MGDINSDGTLTFHSDGYPDMKMTMDIESDSTVNAFISVIGQQDISCPTESYTASDSSISFANIDQDGDCFGDALRGQGKDTSKDTLGAVAAVSGSYTGRVRGIIKITMDFESDST